ncbi:MAG: HEPN domain-containing protein [Candidatus Latescibacteria bacterium]|nr:HEPN domain-containing protein [Candidatus Latescibacterota bacterium]
MDNRDVAREWFNIADADLLSAEFLQNMRPIPVEIICYHCQQSAEKYLKGFLLFHGKTITRSHDLLILNRMCCTIDGSFEEIEEECLMLTDYSVTVRYPFHLDLDESDMKAALKGAKKIKVFVSGKSSAT